MTFKEIQDATLSDRFRDRDRAKQAINLRYGELLAVEDWVFMYDSITVTFTAGNPLVGGVPADVGVVRRLTSSTGWPLKSMTPDDFLAYWEGSTPGTPVAYTAVGDGTITVAPTPTTADTALLTYDKASTSLAADGDIPVTPAWTHVGLVAGAQSFLAQLDNDATYAPLESSFQQMIDAMRREYLVSSKGAFRQWGRDPRWY